MNQKVDKVSKREEYYNNKFNLLYKESSKLTCHSSFIKDYKKVLKKSKSLIRRKED